MITLSNRCSGAEVASCQPDGPQDTHPMAPKAHNGDVLGGHKANRWKRGRHKATTFWSWGTHG
jgi:hypothetical protein